MNRNVPARDTWVTGLVVKQYHTKESIADLKKYDAHAHRDLRAKTKNLNEIFK